MRELRLFHFRLRKWTIGHWNQVVFMIVSEAKKIMLIRTRSNISIKMNKESQILRLSAKENSLRL